GRVILRCAECGRTRELSGEMPEEYTDCFARIVREDGFVPRPGVGLALICGPCLQQKYAGHETVDDQEKLRAKKR
ncbi:MAG TPA: hypothetical protein VM779_12065, partial [Thermoanaerobaculia bacterium]|nr:hypothetical protein [Thermoanaerobaculia bacterium]